MFSSCRLVLNGNLEQLGHALPGGAGAFLAEYRNSAPSGDARIEAAATA